MTIVEFLEARTAEDEAVAREAITPDRPGTHWEWESTADDDDPASPRWLRTVEEFPTTSGVGDLPGFPLHGCTVDPSPAMDHIAHYDPSRALAEVAAKRSLVELYGALSAQWAPNVDYGFSYTTLRTLAAIYSSHPDYQKEWAL